VGADEFEVPPAVVGRVLVRTPTVIIAISTSGVRIAASVTEDGFLRHRDLGRVDADGYLYLAAG